MDCECNLHCSSCLEKGCGEVVHTFRVCGIAKPRSLENYMQNKEDRSLFYDSVEIDVAHVIK